MNEDDLDHAVANSIYKPGAFTTNDGFLRVCSVSGGKDSTALYCKMIDDFGADGFVAVFADTGHEHPVTLNYLRNLPTMSGGPEIVTVKADFSERLKSRVSSEKETNAQQVFDRNRDWLKRDGFTSGSPFLDMMLWKGRAPSSKAQFCTEFLKLRPIRAWLIAERERRDLLPIMYVGIRAGESARRAKMPEEELNEYMDCLMKRPLIHWSEKDVFAFLKERGVPPNPLYDAGFSRVGCFPCIHARKSELARLPEWAWEKLEEWERIIGRSWFPPNMIPDIHIPTIADARVWSKTSRGGRQIDLFAEDAKDVPTCMNSWGHCE